MRKLFAVATAITIVGSVIWFAPAGAQVTCTETGTDRANDMHATNGNDVLCGLGGNDRIAGKLGDDTLLGQKGRDLLTAGAMSWWAERKATR